MYELKTKETDASVIAFIQTIDGEVKREDALQIIDLMSEATGETAKMWGSSIIGFGKYSYITSGKTNEMCKIGFSPRKNEFTLYLNIAGYDCEAELNSLGKHKTGKGCLYLKTLKDINLDVLKSLFIKAYNN